jgi:hypothetical protein
VPDFDTLYNFLGHNVHAFWGGDEAHSQTLHGKLIVLENVQGWGWFFTLDSDHINRSLEALHWIVED